MARVQTTPPMVAWGVPALFPRGVSVVFLFVAACGGETGGTASPGGAGAGGAATAGGGGSTAGTQGTAGATGKGGAGPSVGGSGGVGGTGAGAGGGAAGGSGTGGSTSLGAPMTLVDGQSHPSRLALDAGFVYFTNRGSLTMGSMDGALVKVSKSGGVATVLLGSLPQPSGLVLGPSGLVFATTGDSAVSQVQTNGSGAITLGKATSPVIALAGSGATLVVGEANGQVASVTGAGIVPIAMVPSSPDHIALDGDTAIVTSSQTDAMGACARCT